MCQHFQALLNGYGWEPRVSTLDKAALRALIARIKTEVFHDLCDHH